MNKVETWVEKVLTALSNKTDNKLPSGEVCSSILRPHCEEPLDGLGRYYPFNFSFQKTVRPFTNHSPVFTVLLLNTFLSLSLDCISLEENIKLSKLLLFLMWSKYLTDIASVDNSMNNDCNSLLRVFGQGQKYHNLNVLKQVYCLIILLPESLKSSC